MDKKSSDLNFHQRMEMLVKDMIEKGINLKDALREFEKIFFEQAVPEARRQPDQDGPDPWHPPKHPSQPG